MLPPIAEKFGGLIRAVHSTIYVLPSILYLLVNFTSCEAGCGKDSTPAVRLVETAVSVLRDVKS